MSNPVWAWVETRTKSCLSTLDIGADGFATVSHELALDVRGGPLRRLELHTSDADAEPLADATVTRSSTGHTLPLVVQRGEGGALELEIDHERGVRSGSYLFAVRYRTNLAAGGRLRRRGGAVEVAWIGLRLEDGVDGARAIFRFPSATVGPRLPLVNPNEPDPTFGVLLGETRRTAQSDEIELIRSHVARGEPVLFRVEASAQALPGLLPSAESAAVPTQNPIGPAKPAVPRRVPAWALVGALAGVLFAALLALKARVFGAACNACGTRLRPLVPLPGWIRIPAAGLALGAGLFAGAEFAQPVGAGLGFLAALALAALRAPARNRDPRGPGRWLPLAEKEAFSPSARRLPGAWLDSGTVRGFALLSALVGVAVALAVAELGRSPYHALLVLLAGSLVFPIFLSGRASELVSDRVAFSRRFVSRLMRRFRGTARLRAVAWGRVPDEASEHDELRLLVQPRDPLGGLVAIEAGVEPERGLGGWLAAPFVIVRAREGSAAQRALSHATWTRGRRADERVAILKPKLPTLGLTEELVLGLTALLSAQPGASSRMSSGSSARTSKPLRVPSPAHAT